MHAVTESDFFAPGAAVELEWRLSNWPLQTGLGYQRCYESGKDQHLDISYIDTNYNYITESREVSWVDSSWVVTGINQGQYVFDTLSTVVRDTVVKLTLDTIQIYAEHPVPPMFMSSRFAVPIRLSYGRRFGSFYGDIGAALAGNFTTYQYGYIDDAQKTSFSLDVNVRPALGYQINRSWSTELGFSYNRPLHQGAADEVMFDKGQYWSLVVGLRYFLD